MIVPVTRFAEQRDELRGIEERPLAEILLRCILHLDDELLAGGVRADRRAATQAIGGRDSPAAETRLSLEGQEAVSVPCDNDGVFEPDKIARLEGGCLAGDTSGRGLPFERKSNSSVADAPLTRPPTKVKDVNSQRLNFIEKAGRCFSFVPGGNYLLRFTARIPNPL